MRILIRISFIGIIIFAFSCGQEIKKQNTIPTDKCIFIDYSESTDCEVLEFYYKVTNKIDSFCGDTPMFFDDFSEYFPSKKVFYVDGILKPDSLTVLMFWKKEVNSFPFKYSLVTVDSLQNDSILWFRLKNKIHYLLTNDTFIDTIVSIRKEQNKKVKYITTISIKNWGFILKKNIYDNDNWEEKNKDFNFKKANIVDVMPEFKGGEEKRIKYLSENIIYPEKAKKDGICGKVIVQFFVDSVGKINNVSILRGIDPLLDSAAINAIKKMPKWTPGKNNGKDTTVRMVMPIHFKLE